MKDRELYKDIGEETIEKILTGQKDQTSVLVFTADWLGASQILDTFFADLAIQYQNKLDIYRCNTAAMNGLIEKIGIETIPTTLIVKDGAVIDYFTGILSKKKIREKLEALP